jgi:hypothetical protein
MERKLDLTRPFVRFRYENSETPVDVVETAETDEKYHLLQVGDMVDLKDGSTSMIKRRVLLGANDIVFYCR